MMLSPHTLHVANVVNLCLDVALVSALATIHIALRKVRRVQADTDRQLADIRSQIARTEKEFEEYSRFVAASHQGLPIRVADFPHVFRNVPCHHCGRFHKEHALGKLGHAFDPEHDLYEQRTTTFL